MLWMTTCVTVARVTLPADRRTMREDRKIPATRGEVSLPGSHQLGLLATRRRLHWRVCLHIYVLISSSFLPLGDVFITVCKRSFYFYTCLSFCPQGVSRPRPRGVVGGSGQGWGVQAQALGGTVQAQAWGGVSQHALTQTPPSRQLLLRMVCILQNAFLLEGIFTYLCSHQLSLP